MFTRFSLRESYLVPNYEGAFSGFGAPRVLIVFDEAIQGRLRQTFMSCVRNWLITAYTLARQFVLVFVRYFQVYIGRDSKDVIR